MRKYLVLAGLSSLAACSGGGSQSVGSAGGSAPPASSGSSATTTHTFVTPTAAKTYNGVGGSLVYEYLTDERVVAGQQAVTYAGSASTVRNSSVVVAYDPRDATFTLTVTDPQSGAAAQTRFQDPASRTNFGGTVEPQWGTPLLADTNVRYLQAGDGNPRSPYGSSGSGLVDAGDNDTPPDGTAGSSYQAASFFYEVPGTANRAGTTTRYVTYAGYVRNSVSFAKLTLPDGSLVNQDNWHLERGAFAYGEQTLNSAVPTSGSATFKGAMLATMVVNPTLDGSFGTELPSFFQWIDGTSQTDVNFGTGAVAFSATGTVTAPQIDRYTTPTTSTIPAGATFTAAGSATIDLVQKGGFTGSITSASFSSTTNGAPTAVNIAGSSIDGAFFGPAAQEVGGGFRVVGGTPDQRVDILGAFTGAKP